MKRIGLGLIGPGRRWERYRVAAALLDDEVCVRAVCDPSPARARDEAVRLGCDVVAGVHELIARPDVDAVVLPGGTWYGLWPADVAIRLSKPVLAGLPLVGEERQVEALIERS